MIVGLVLLGLGFSAVADGAGLREGLEQQKPVVELRELYIENATEFLQQNYPDHAGNHELIAVLAA
ncbi:MAG: hypothetical protein OI74_15645 [Gammaproteobacteria bacterium (ex Lamellibrachia satsuma)]|nr:MAG: hypothetical protein HPY30_14380 [Gammaproteobacteria bacterium (ex Lamellibrachia satsuma)]RRS31033.1 MAG: hypothetical protein OI74_15645 [Gammaproteobacteria bacterium (ex Lamellibrachia satsuma)]RRS34727.1 MAG: hypothetical protein NV67_12310 [Gammaproteobacteria bacterium (ex Lamellibrachia satsuma)]